MNGTMIGVIGLVILFILMFSGMPVWAVFGFMGVAGVLYIRGVSQGLAIIGTAPYASMNQYFWTVVPLFVLMGYFTLHSDLAAEFYEGCRKWVGHYKGGLAIAVILAMTAFGAPAGEPVGACVTFTALTLPEMRRYKYKDGFTLGCIAAGGLLATLLPPSMGFIIYGSLTATSIGKLFIAGIIPGFLLTVVYIIVILILIKRNPSLGPAAPPVPIKQRFQGVVGLWALSFIFIIIIAGLYMGLFTPTESGGMGAFIVLVLGIIRRKLPWKEFKKSLQEAAASTGMIGLLLIGTVTFNLFLVMTDVPGTLASTVTELNMGKWGTMFLILLILFILGMFMDGLAIALLTIPIFTPIAKAAGWDLVHYGIINSIMGGIGSLTPPFGIVIFAITGTAKDVPMNEVFKGSYPFIAGQFILEGLVLAIPALSLWLPSQMIK